VQEARTLSGPAPTTFLGDHTVRLTRRFLAASFATALAAVGTATAAGAHNVDPGGMTPQQMKCMSKSYTSEHKKLCKRANEAPVKNGGAVTLAHKLRYTKSGLIDTRHIDFSGIKGLSKREAKTDKQLLVSTIKTITKWNDPNAAVADGFQSIGDGLTGEEHFLHWDWIDDNDIFDPEHPESLVYHVDRRTGAKQLEAAMYILPKQYTLDKTPKKYTNELVQFHQHDNLCFTQGTAPRVAGLTNAQGGCNPPLVKFNPNIQVHVWIRSNECGPFASLLGIGAGQIKAGTQRSCVHDPNRLGL
jgi:hypothetical protein